MKRKILLLVLMFLPLMANAYDAEIDGIYYNFSGDEATVISWPLDGGKTYSGSIVIPESVVYNEKSYNVTSIGMQAFRGCSGLISVNIPESVTRIEEYTFYECPNLVSVNLPENMTSIEGYAFFHCSTLSFINIPKGITRIGSHAFSKCSSLASFNIPEGSRGIEKAAFAGCSNLKTVVIPESVIYIEWFGFSGCTGLSSIVCNAKNPPSVGQFGFDGVDKQSCKLYIPEGCEEAYRNAKEWKDFNIMEMGTGISEVKSEDPLTPFRGNEKCEDAVYDLSGRKVNSQFSIFNSHFRKKGIYIQNGKKVAVK